MLPEFRSCGQRHFNPTSSIPVLNSRTNYGAVTLGAIAPVVMTWPNGARTAEHTFGGRAEGTCVAANRAARTDYKWHT
jgi:hypothetical protein